LFAAPVFAPAIFGEKWQASDADVINLDLEEKDSVALGQDSAAPISSSESAT